MRFQLAEREVSWANWGLERAAPDWEYVLDRLACIGRPRRDLITREEGADVDGGSQDAGTLGKVPRARLWQKHARST